MKTVVWIGVGLGCYIAAAALHGGSAPQQIMTSGAAGTVPELLLVAAGNVCIWRGIRSALADLWGGLTGKSIRENAGRKRFVEDAEPQSDFDADEAFARYMQQRKARETEPATERQAAPAPKALAMPPARPPAQGGFGRKVV
ncbi:hypothetical protein [Erythrobacter sp. CCH5-A1]|jgi:hypothetical protein|uniref:hypothetical protein n=1 Tax=Erythrobacter sp. CCH5-A1 TaxID=1768792 RepID=UPI00083030DC|nr:hypothetical protein [Erythrobacter sp. CCH5-A1]